MLPNCLKIEFKLNFLVQVVSGNCHSVLISSSSSNSSVVVVSIKLKIKSQNKMRQQKLIKPIQIVEIINTNIL